MTLKKQAALQALLTCSTKAEAAKQAGIGERTLRSYFQDDEFKREYSRLCDDLLHEVTRDLQRALPVAVETLRSVCEDPEASPPTRITAAYKILDLARDYVMQDDIMTRLEKLERMKDNEKT